MGELQSVCELYDAAVVACENLMKNTQAIDENGLYALERTVRAMEIKKLFAGPWDKNDAIMSIAAGAGGQDAADWVHMLFLMYQKYAQRQGWKLDVLDLTEETFQSKTGRHPLKNITFEIQGAYAFGYLKKESGVHRLVRVSPFSSDGLRHTSFALVDVMPKIKESTLNIKESDLKVEFFRSSGPGGQNVNKVETAVRIIHVPTGVVVSCQVERSQSQNRARAMGILESKLVQMMEKERVAELSALKTKAKPEWGNQIRSYVLNPYKLIKDHRTNYETNRIESVLDEGYLDDFIEAEITAQINGV